jgi:DNA-binding protein H-NS
MKQDVSSLSEQELAHLIAEASKELEYKRGAAKRETIAKIRELAKSIGVQVEIREGELKATQGKRPAVPVKYRDPNNPKNAWSGRGIRPRWLQQHLNQGHSIDEFKV